YVSFLNENGFWGEAIKLGNEINEIHSVVPVISPDGKYIFFSRENDIWWVSTEVIEQLRERFQQ
ncbi:MAG: hypothetical protein MI702_06345, partial [Chlorobiales bacterium]|nr:hypothetical protein [Chlorobiales bacterium]